MGLHIGEKAKIYSGEIELNATKIAAADGFNIIVL
jgi:predicted regulator of amino acid metabolism with ACT domain